MKPRLIAYERSGIVRKAFRDAGFDAWSCDLEQAEDGSKYHIKGDAIETIRSRRWSLIVAHPPCQYLCVSGLHWNKRRPERAEKTREAQAEFLKAVCVAYLNSERYVFENPVGCMSKRWRKPDQYIQPFEFGSDASKKTGLWLHNLPRLKPTQMIAPRMVDGKPRWANQTDSGQNRLGPSPNRSMDRARTYAGIARAMVEQWGPLIKEEIV